MSLKTYQHEQIRNCCDDSLLSEETTTIIKETEEAQRILPYLCPLCFSIGIRQPVLLHSSTQTEVKNSVCIACAECAKRWFNMNASIDSTRSSCIITGHNNNNNNNNNNNMNNNNEAMLIPLQCPQCMVTIPSNITPVPFTTCPMNSVIKNCKVHIDNNQSPFTTTKTKTTKVSGSICGICEEATADQFCVPCGFPLCVSCQESSHQRGRYRTHNVVPLRAAPQRRKVHMCETHTTQTLELYCFTCSAAVCLTCCFGGHHKGHTVEPLADVAEKRRWEVRQEVKEQQEDAVNAGETVRSLHAATISLETRFAKVREMIQQQFDTLRSVLNSREEELQQELIQYEHSVKNAMTQRALQCESISNAVEEMAGRVEDVINSTDAVELMGFDTILKKSIGILGTVATQTFMDSHSALQIVEERLTCEDGVVAFSTTQQEKDECVKLLNGFGSLQFPLLSHRTISISGTNVDEVPNSEKERMNNDVYMGTKNSLSIDHFMNSKNFQIKEDDTFKIHERSSLQCVRDSFHPISQQRDTTPSVCAAAALTAPFSSYGSPSQELQLVWDHHQLRNTDDCMRSTVPSLMIPSSNISNIGTTVVDNTTTFTSSSSVSSLSFRKGTELHGLQTRKRLLDIDINTVTDKEMLKLMPSCKQRKMVSEENLSGTIEDGAKGLILSKRTVKPDDGVTSTSLLQEGKKVKLIDISGKSDDSITPTAAVGSSLHLQLQF